MNIIQFSISIFFCFFLNFNVGYSQAKSLNDLGIKTNFEITSNNQILSKEQVLIQRPTIVSGTYDTGGYAYNWYRLEFRSIHKVLSFDHPRRNNILSVKFFKDGYLLTELVISPKKLNRVKADEKFNFVYYSLDLMHVPWLLLQEADSIDLLILR